MALLSTRKRTLAAVGTAGVLGALAFGGIAYAVGDGGTGESGYVTVVNDPTGEPGASGSSDGSARSDQDRRDCPEKGGSPDGSQRGESPSPESPSPESPSQDTPSPEQSPADNL